MRKPLKEMLLIILCAALVYPFAFLGSLAALLFFGEGSSLTNARVNSCIVVSLGILSLVFVRLYWPNKVLEKWWSVFICLFVIWTPFFLFLNKTWLIK